MIGQMLRPSAMYIGTFVAMAILTSSATLGQSSSAPVTLPCAAASSDRSALPDCPSPNSSLVQPTQQIPDIAPMQSSSSQPPVLAYASLNAQVTVFEDTLIRVMTNQPLSSKWSKNGTAMLFTLSEDVIVDNVIVIPRGVTVHGELVQTRKAGVLTGSPELTLKLVSLDLGGRSYPLYTYQFKVQGTSKAKPTETKVKGGAVIGAIVGGVFSGSAKGETTAVGKLTGMGTGACRSGCRSDSFGGNARTYTHDPCRVTNGFPSLIPDECPDGECERGNTIVAGASSRWPSSLCAR